jgi:hypothetical protein
MGKTIKLKLTLTEKKYIKKIKDESNLKNKDVLRNALWFYIEQREQPYISPLEKVHETGSIISESTPTHDYIAHLKDEIFFLREENIKIQEYNHKFQEHFEDEIKRLHEQFNQVIPFIESIKPTSEKELPSIVVTSIQNPDGSTTNIDDADVLDKINQVLDKKSPSSTKTETVNQTKKTDLKHKKGFFQRIASTLKIR